MPNRILREGILTSERVNLLAWEAEVFYRRLMSVVDDFGRFSAHPSLLRAALFPLKLDTVRDANMERLLASVEQARLVRVYEVAGKRYLELIDFKQQVRAKDSKYPSPTSTCTADATQAQSTSAAHAPVFGVGDVSEDGGEDEKKGARKRAPSFDAMKVELPEWLESEHWGIWVRHRQAMRKPLTEDAARLSIKSLDEYRGQGHAPQRVIEHAVANGNQGLYPPPERRTVPRNGSPQSESFRERDQRLATERYEEFVGIRRPVQTEAEVIDVTPRRLGR